MKLAELPIYSYMPPTPFSTVQAGYSERYITELMTAFYDWATKAQLDPMPVFYNYLIHLLDPTGVYLEQSILPDLSTLYEPEYGMPVIWTTDDYGTDDLGPNHHHGQANGTPFPPGILATHGKNYAGNYLEDLKDTLDKLLDEQGLSLSWWAADYKELTWQSSWPTSGIWSEYGSRDDGVNRYNLLTDHIEMMRAHPRSIVQGPLRVSDARLAGGNAVDRAPDIWNGILVTTEGLVARLEDCWVYSNGVLYPEWDTPENPERMRFVDTSAYGAVVDGCSGNSQQALLTSDGNITLVFNRAVQGTCEIQQRYGDGRVDQYGPFKAIEYASSTGLDYGIEPAWPFTLLLAGDHIAFATFSTDPMECRVRSRMSLDSDLTGVCMEMDLGLAKEGRPWEWRVLSNKDSSLKVSGWGVGLPGTGTATIELTTPEYVDFRPTGVYMRVESPVGGAMRATDSYPPPPQVWRLPMPAGYETWSMARYSTVQLSGRAYLHLLMVEDYNDWDDVSGGVTQGSKSTGITHLSWPLPNALELNSLPAEVDGLYDPPTYTLTTPATILPIFFPDEVVKNYGGADHNQIFQYWQVGNIDETGTAWVFSVFYWYEDTDPTGIDVSIVHKDLYEQISIAHFTQGAATLTDKGWALLRSGSSSRIVPVGKTLDQQIQDEADSTAMWISNEIGILNWHTQGGMLISGVVTGVAAQPMIGTFSLTQDPNDEYKYTFEMDPEDGWWTDVLKPVFEQSTAFVGLW